MINNTHNNKIKITVIKSAPLISPPVAFVNHTNTHKLSTCNDIKLSESPHCVCACAKMNFNHLLNIIYNDHANFLRYLIKIQTNNNRQVCKFGFVEW